MPKKNNYVLKDLPILNWNRIENKSVKRASLEFKSVIETNIKAIEDCSKEERCSKADGTYLCCPYKNGTCCGTLGYCWYFLRFKFMFLFHKKYDF